MWHHVKGTNLCNTYQLDTIIVLHDSRLGSRIAQWQSDCQTKIKSLLLYFAVKISSTLNYLLLLI